MKNQSLFIILFGKYNKYIFQPLIEIMDLLNKNLNIKNYVISKTAKSIKLTLIFIEF